MNEATHFIWAVAATISVIAGLIFANQAIKTSEERAFLRCTVAGTALVESAGRVACAEAIFGKGGEKK